MNTKKTVITFVSAMVLSTSGLMAQKGPVAAGGEASGTGGSVSFSIGQIDYITATGIGGRITQGIQQPYEIFRVSVENLDIELLASVFPNPTRDGITLRIPLGMPMDQLAYRVFDLTGKIITEKNITSHDTSVDLTSVANATYLLKVYNNEQEVSTFKIIKNQ